MLHRSASKPFSGEYPLSKGPHRGSNEEQSWARRYIYILNDSKGLRWPHISFSLIGSGKGFSEIQATKRVLRSPLSSHTNILRGWSPFTLSHTSKLKWKKHKMLYRSASKPFSGEYPLSKGPHRGSNEERSWARRHICAPDDFKALRGTHMVSSLIRSGQSFPEIHGSHKWPGRPLSPNHHFLQGGGPLLFCPRWVPFELTFTWGGRRGKGQGVKRWFEP